MHKIPHFALKIPPFAYSFPAPACVSLSYTSLTNDTPDQYISTFIWCPARSPVKSLVFQEPPEGAFQCIYGHFSGSGWTAADF